MTDAKRRRKPDWAREKERRREDARAATYWMFGLHAVAAALANPARRKHRLIVTPNAAAKLEAEIAASGLAPEVSDPRRFAAPLAPDSVHQGAALEVSPLDWPSLSELCAPRGEAPRVLLLDRVSDPHNVGAILRTAEVLGARAVVAPARHSAPETGALAKAASGALERQPYLRVRNLATAMRSLREMGYLLVGLDGAADATLGGALRPHRDAPIGLVLGAEGPGMRHLTAETCDLVARIPAASDFGSLNVSNAAAIALYEAVRPAE